MQTEQEKMLAGVLYQPWDEALFAKRQYAKEVLYQLNQLSPNALAERSALLRDLLGRVGENAYVELPFRCDYGENIEIGDHFYANYNLTILDCAKVTIGSRVLIAPNVLLSTAAHPLDAATRATGLEYAQPIKIGDDVWLGANVVVLPNVTIGARSVIGAGSVVTRDIPEDCVAVGNPCLVLRSLKQE